MAGVKLVVGIRIGVDRTARLQPCSFAVSHASGVEATGTGSGHAGSSDTGKTMFAALPNKPEGRNQNVDH